MNFLRLPPYVPANTLQDRSRLWNLRQDTFRRWAKEGFKPKRGWLIEPEVRKP